MGDLIELVKKFQSSRDPQVADEIVVRISPNLHLFLSLHGPSELVDDVLQETLVAIFLGLLRFEGGTNAQFFGYCYQIARNKLTDALRRLGKESGRVYPDENFWEHIAESEPTLSKREREELDEVLALIAAVRPPCLDYLIAHYIMGMTYAEMAEQFGFPSEDAARMATRRCLQLARELLE